VHREVNPTLSKCLLNLLHKDTLAIDIRRRHEAGLLHTIPRSANHFDLGCIACTAQRIKNMVRLPKCEL
jgi:hypothetical protein